MMDGMFGGRGMGGMGGMMSAMQNMPRGGPGGQMSSSMMVMSSQMGPDGRMHTERFAESTVSDGRARESQQAYSNSRTGMDKMGLERQLGERGRKMVKERNHFSGEERQTNLLRGMDESHQGQFDQDWQQQAGHFRHPGFGQYDRGASIAFGPGGARQQQLPGPGRHGPARSGMRGLDDRRR